MQERERIETSKPGAETKGPYLQKKAQYQEPPTCKAELYASIKKSSKYYHQGLDNNGAPINFPVQSISYGSYSFRLNHNNYRSRDLFFYVKDVDGQFLKLN